MRTTFSYAYVLEYIPTRHAATDEQKNDRYAVYDFKNGSCNSRIFNGFVNYIKSIVGNAKSEYVICFIPASTQWKTQRRYAELASRLQNATGVQACYNAIYRTEDHEAGHISGGTANPLAGIAFDSSYFKGKKVILVDDVITRGRTFMRTANAVLDHGATVVVGLLVAKTVNPDWKSARA